MAMLPQINGFNKLYDTNQTADQAAPAAQVASLPDGFIRTLGYQTLRMKFTGDTNNDDTDVAIYSVDPIGGVDRQDDTGFFVELIGTLATVLVGTTTGIEGNKVLTASDLLADTLTTYTEATWGTYLLNTVGGNTQKFSPGSNGIGEFLISDVTNIYGVAVQFVTMNTGDSFNCLYQLSTV